MAGRPETHSLGVDGDVRMQGVIGSDKARDIREIFMARRLAGVRVDGHSNCGK